MQERNAPIEITENGRRKKAPKIEVIMKKTFNEALSGKPKAIDTIFKLESLYGTDQPSSGASGTEPQDAGWQDERDCEVLDDFLAEYKAMVLDQDAAKGTDAEAGADTAADAAAKAEADAASSSSNAAGDRGGADSDEVSNDGADKAASPSTADDGEKANDEPAVTFDRPLRSFRNGEWT